MLDKVWVMGGDIEVAGTFLWWGSCLGESVAKGEGEVVVMYNEEPESVDERDSNCLK